MFSENFIKIGLSLQKLVEPDWFREKSENIVSKHVQILENKKQHVPLDVWDGSLKNIRAKNTKLKRQEKENIARIAKNCLPVLTDRLSQSIKKSHIVPVCVYWIFRSLGTLPACDLINLASILSSKCHKLLTIQYFATSI